MLRKSLMLIEQSVNRLSNYRSGQQRCSFSMVFGNGFKQATRLFSSSTDFDEFDLPDIHNDEYNDFLREVCSIPDSGHHVLVLHPDIKWGPHKKLLTTPDLMMAEACALIDTLQNWKIVEKKMVSVKFPKNRRIFGSGTLEQLKDISFKRNVTAVFLNVDILKAHQKQFFSKLWGVPVFDRYMIVLQIFKDHARTNEAKLQIALAEIPYLRGHIKNYSKQGGIQQITGTSEGHVHGKVQLLEDRAVKLKKLLDKLKKQRRLIRKSRIKKDLPVIAVVGYTNAGKTTLIKALTGDKDLVPENHLFATLDITAHAGVLPNRMTVIYMDTVGFIADIPMLLLDAFSATLEDALIADLVIHVRDISHPDTLAQKHNVIETLMQIYPENYQENVIEVNNKSDLVIRDYKSISATSGQGTPLSVSATSGQGIPELKAHIEKIIMERTGRKRRKIKVPVTGQMLSWLHKEATVNDVVPDDSQQNFIVDCVMTDAAHEKMKSLFGRERQK